MPTDRRILRTRKRLQEALLSLINEKGYDQITIQDILDRADVGRSTFYSHFLNKDDLMLGNLKADLLTLKFEQTEDGQLPSVAWLFEHTKSNFPLYRALSKSDVIHHIFQNLTEGFQRNWLQYLESRNDTGNAFNLPRPAVAAYLSNALIGLLKWWLENGAILPPHEMHNVFQQITMNGLYGKP